MNTYHRHSCSACDSIFKTEEEITQHIESEHTIYNDSCPHCEESFPGKSMLEGHISTKHKFLCRRCEAVMMTNEALEEHTLESHTFL